ncbi:MAG: hypothetical protein H0X45_14030, partial [Planctomycetes bacterium]|nr:hypothetical protein [Planctomycetota bacterium]
MLPSRPCAGAFTLFEIAISLALVALSVTSVLMLFPMGIRAQQTARFQLYAATKAKEMVESFLATHNSNPNIDAEGLDAWDSPLAYRLMAPDLESRLSTPSFGIMPLPPDIARRLDSNDDEIARIIGQGGCLYYSQPMATANIDQAMLAQAPPNEAQKLVFAVTGYAQSNAIFSFPWKAWPYYLPYPSPPGHGIHLGQALPPQARPDAVWGPTVCWEELMDPSDLAMQKVYAWQEGSDWYGYRPYCYDGATFDFDGAKRYLQSALWYAKRQGLGAAFWDPPSPTDPSLLARDFAVGAEGASVARHHQVHAMRFISHAATCVTRWKKLAELSGAGVPIPSVVLDGASSPAIALTHDLIAYYHERAMNLIMLFAASYPYDWGVPRPLQRACMMDCPLIEWDLFSPPTPRTPINGAPSVLATQWKPVPAQPIENIGRSSTYPVAAIPRGAPADFWGDPDHFTLTRRFDPAERCRRLVFWTVDWQSYEDFETAPSAPVDASKYPIAGPMLEFNTTTPATFERRMEWFNFTDAL